MSRCTFDRMQPEPTLAELPMAERFIRALALSAYVRQLAWQGAVLHAGQQGHDAVVVRFLRQLYGDDIARSFRTAPDHAGRGE